MEDCNCNNGGLKDFNANDFTQPIKNNPLLTAGILALTGGLCFLVGRKTSKKGKR